MNGIVVEEFKGGSLGKTVLIQANSGELRVRKSVSSRLNREYGLVRWHSQFKRLQRYEQLVPNLFPKVLEVGYQAGEYYFEIEYLKDFQDLKSYLFNTTLDLSEISEIARRVISSASEIHHQLKLETFQGSLGLYYQEEVLQKLDDAMQIKEFEEFVNYSEFNFNGSRYLNINRHFDWLQEFVAQDLVTSECLTHGNLTLENIMINPKSGIVQFIDPYDENIVDCPEADFSQILQCSSSHYGYLSGLEPKVSGPKITLNYVPPKSLMYFDQVFRGEINKLDYKLNQELIAFFHMSQFIRMLPFKVKANEIEKAKLFFVIACKLAQELRDTCDY